MTTDRQRTRRRDARQVWSLLVVISLIAVGIGAVRSAPPEKPFEDLVEVARAANRFEAADIDSYEVVVERHCLCVGSLATYALTVEDGEVTRVVAKGALGNDAPRRLEWDHVPRRFDWLEEWGPIERALASIGASVAADAAAEGSAAMYVDEGEHKLVRRMRFDPDTGRPRSYSTSITNTYDSGVSFTWSRFRPLP